MDNFRKMGRPVMAVVAAVMAIPFLVKGAVALAELAHLL